MVHYDFSFGVDITFDLYSQIILIKSNNNKYNIFYDLITLR